LVPVAFWNEIPVRWPVGADAGDSDRCLVGISLQPGDQALQIIRRQALLADDQQRLAADLDDRLEIFQEIEL
jgi:hypothetical protein